jgi:hypothetical protein
VKSFLLDTHEFCNFEVMSKKVKREKKAKCRLHRMFPNAYNTVIRGVTDPIFFFN